MKFFFRKPVFPILVDTGAELVVLRRPGEGERLRSRLADTGLRSFDVIDARAQGFAYHLEHDAISPLTLKKVWRKAGIIALYNARKPPGAPTYAPDLATRKLAEVMADVVNLLRPGRTGGATRTGFR